MPANFWWVIPSIGSVFGLFAFITAFIYYGYRESLRAKYKALEGVKDPETRYKILREIIGRYSPQIDNLRVADKVRQLELQANNDLRRFRMIVVSGTLLGIALIACSLIVAVTTGGHTETPRTDKDRTKDSTSGLKDPQIRLSNVAGLQILRDKDGNAYAPSSWLYATDQRDVAYRAFSVDISKVSDHDVLIIRSVRLHLKRLDNIKAVGVTVSPPSSVTRALIFQAELQHDSTVVECKYKSSEEFKNEMILLSNDIPILRCNVVVTRSSKFGELLPKDESPFTNAIWDASIEVESEDTKSGKRHAVRSEESVRVYVSIPSHDS